MQTQSPTSGSLCQVPQANPFALYSRLLDLGSGGLLGQLGLFVLQNNAHGPRPSQVWLPETTTQGSVVLKSKVSRAMFGAEDLLQQADI